MNRVGVSGGRPQVGLGRKRRKRIVNQCSGRGRGRSPTLDSPSLSGKLVRIAGLEPARITPLPPQSSASANSAICAKTGPFRANGLPSANARQIRILWTTCQARAATAPPPDCIYNSSSVIKLGRRAGGQLASLQGHAKLRRTFPGKPTYPGRAGPC